MSVRSYSDIRHKIEQDLGDLTSPAARHSLVQHLTELTFELERLRAYQKTVLAAVRARDILASDQAGTDGVAAAMSLELNARDALDASDNLHDMEWENDVWHRWTGPEHDTTIRVWLDRAMPMVFEMALHSYGDDRNRRALALTVDGASLQLHEVGDKLVRSDPLPVLTGSYLTEVGIHVPWLLGAPNAAAAKAPPDGGKKRAARAKVAAESDASGPVRGIAITQLRFCVPS